MPDVQFITLLSTGIGSFVLVTLAWINQNQRLGDFRSDMHRQMDSLGKRLDERFSSFRDEVNRRFDRVDARLSMIEADLKEFFTVTGKLDGRIEQLSRNK